MRRRWFPALIWAGWTLAGIAMVLRFAVLAPVTYPAYCQHGYGHMSATVWHSHCDQAY